MTSVNDLHALTYYDFIDPYMAVSEHYQRRSVDNGVLLGAVRIEVDGRGIIFSPDNLQL